jgi:serine/threonine protein kinase
LTLTPGTRLGPYEIGTPLGAGGMGEVYKARDTRLDRTVAIKILPAALASDPRLVPITSSPDGRSLSVGTPAVLFRAAPFSGFTPNARIEYVVSADGERFLVNRATEGSMTTPITVVANWTAALSK